MTLKSKPTAMLTAVFCSLLWASAFPTLKVLYQVVGPASFSVAAKWQLAGFRFFMAGLLVALVSKVFFGLSLSIRRKDLPHFVGLGLLQTFLQYTFFYVGVGQTSGILSAILTTSGTFFTVLVAHFFIPGDRLNRHKVLGIVLGFAGILVLNLGEGLRFEPTFTLTGEGFLLFAGLTNAFAILLVRRLLRNYHPFVINAYQLLIGSTLLITSGLMTAGGVLPLSPSALALLFYGALITATAFSLWYGLLQYHAAGEITIFKFVIPVAGALLSATLLPDEHFNPTIFLSLTLTSIGMIQLYLRSFLKAVPPINTPVSLKKSTR